MARIAALDSAVRAEHSIQVSPYEQFMRSLCGFLKHGSAGPNTAARSRVVAISKLGCQWSGLARIQPHAQEAATTLWFGPIFKLGPPMEQHVVVDELDVAAFELHIQTDGVR